MIHTQWSCDSYMDTHLLLEGFIKLLHPHLVEKTEALPQETVEPQVGALLAAALDQHESNFTLKQDYVTITSYY